MRQHPSDAATAAQDTAAANLAAAGVPCLSLTTSFPSVDALERAARSGISDQFVVNLISVIAWIAWAQLALALVVETASIARGRQAIHLPVLPGFQATAARLVTGILMLASTVQPARAVAAPPPIPVVIQTNADATAPTVDTLVSVLGTGRCC